MQQPVSAGILKDRMLSVPDIFIWAPSCLKWCPAVLNISSAGLWQWPFSFLSSPVSLFTRIISSLFFTCNTGKTLHTPCYPFYTCSSVKLSLASSTGRLKNITGCLIRSTGHLKNITECLIQSTGCLKHLTEYLTGSTGHVESSTGGILQVTGFLKHFTGGVIPATGRG